MGKKEPLIDGYIAKAAPFAQPVLKHIRNLVHAVCPDVEERVKWGMPHFDYKGAMMCSMAAFKQHCAFGFWKAKLMKDGAVLTGMESHTAMGNMGKITSVKDLPSDTKMMSLIKEAMMLNEKGVKVPKDMSPKYPKKEMEAPEYFLKALKKNKAAFQVYEQFSPSHQREYIEWVTEARQEETRNRRLEQAIAMMAEGKGRNWKYEKK
jgi:uncharacterized protein YdeI (YjbR/CyaY-like superfamily)